MRDDPDLTTCSFKDWRGRSRLHPFLSVCTTCHIEEGASAMGVVPTPSRSSAILPDCLSITTIVSGMVGMEAMPQLCLSRIRQPWQIAALFLT